MGEVAFPEYVEAFIEETKRYLESFDAKLYLLKEISENRSRVYQISRNWTVVDFKIDREIEQDKNQYRAQVAAYVEAVRTATKMSTRGFLFVV
jgi:hypothetical protein